MQAASDRAVPAAPVWAARTVPDIAPHLLQAQNAPTEPPNQTEYCRVVDA